MRQVHSPVRGQTIASRQRRGVALRNAIEALEDRRLLTSFFVNFTGQTPTDVPGYMMDIGSAYGDRADRGNAGVSYGWVKFTDGTPFNNTANARNRNDAASPDERYDTFNHMMKPSNTDQSQWANWEIAVPNSTYSVRIVSGDIQNTNSKFVINAEGVRVLDAAPGTAAGIARFVDGTGIATVSDGKLTIATPANGTASGADNNKIAFIEITETALTLKATGIGGKVELNWPGAAGSVSYDIYRGTAAGAETLLQSGVASNKFTDTAVTVGQTYYYYVKGANGAGTGLTSLEASARVSATYAHINFAPATAAVPSGYLVDSGSAFGDRGNTFSYGWMNSATGLAAPTANPAVRERNNAISPDKRYDTFDHFHKAGESPATGAVWWEIAVPNGTYQVHVVGGESDNADTYLSLVAEANKDVNGIPQADGSGISLVHQNIAGSTGLARWVDSGTLEVVVTDGNLTISEGLDAANNKIAFIDIDTLTVASTPAAPTLLNISNLKASQLTLSWTDNATNETGFRIEQSANGVDFAPLATASAQPGTGIVTYQVAGLTPGTQYYYRVYAVNLQGDSPAASNTANATTAAATSTITPRIHASSGEVNLSNEGTLDWAHWGLGGAADFNHKSSLISDATPLNNSLKLQVINSPTTFTWTGGTPVSDAFVTPNALATSGYGHGFSFTVPADTTPRLLRVYVGVQNVRGQLTARLSDGSAADFVDSSLFNAGTADTYYQLVYTAASAGQTLTVNWLEIPPNGDQVGGRLSLKAATLQLVPTAPTGVTNALTATALPSGRTYLGWTDATTGEEGYLIERAPDVAGAPGTYAQLAQTFDPTILNYLDLTTAPGTKYYYRVRPVNAADNPGTYSNVASVTTNAAIGTGATATYFDNPDLNGPGGADLKNPIPGAVWPVSVVNPTINFDFTTNAPAGAGAGFGVDTFMVRWTANVRPDLTGNYTFFADVDDGYRLYINGQKVLDGLDRRGGLNTLFPTVGIPLVGGQMYSLIFDMVENGGNAGAKLSWKGDITPQEIIPAASLFPTAADFTAPTITSVEWDAPLPASAPYTSKAHLSVSFSEDISASLDINDLQITDPFSNMISGVNLYYYDPATNTAVLTFPTLLDETLPDGNWTLTGLGAQIGDPSGNLLDGDGNGTGGDNAVKPFYVFLGDTQRNSDGTSDPDRKVGFTDYQRVALNFGKGLTDRVSGSDGDFNHDGLVDNADFLLLQARMNLTLPAPAPAVPAAAKPAAKTAAKVVAKKPAAIAKPAPAKPAPTRAPAAFASKKITGLKQWLSSN